MFVKKYGFFDALKKKEPGNINVQFKIFLNKTIK